MKSTEPLNLRATDPISGTIGQAQTPAPLRPRLEREQLPSNWHYMLPESKPYFGPRVAKLSKPNASGWAHGQCPFHDDPAAGFRVNLKHQPHWHCFGGCGSGSMVDFHMRMYCLDFPEAVAELLQGVV